MDKDKVLFAMIASLGVVQVFVLVSSALLLS
jgi:hypothetical protein